jgi:hypothetical protein
VTQKPFSDSLSFGMVAAIDTGLEDDVIILSAGKFSNKTELEKVIASYAECYWRKHPEAADATRRAYDEGRILVPRLEGYLCPQWATQNRHLYPNWQAWRQQFSSNAPFQLEDCEVTEDQILACSSVEEVYRLFPEALSLI